VSDLTTNPIHERVTAVIVGKFGRLENDLNTSGLVDSLGAMELLLLLQDEFQIHLADVRLKDLSSVGRIVSVIEAVMARR
jgi:acyl carrier protein